MSAILKVLIIPRALNIRLSQFKLFFFLNSFLSSLLMLVPSSSVNRERLINGNVELCGFFYRRTHMLTYTLENIVFHEVTNK